MRKLVIGRAARSDISEIAHYIAQESGEPAIAQAFVATLRQKCAHMATLPGMLGRARPELAEGLRSSAVGNYIVFFHYLPGTLRVARIIEGHRDMPRHIPSKP